MTTNEQQKQDEKTNREWLQLGKAAIKALGQDQTKWCWKLFQEKSPPAIKLLVRIRKQQMYDLFMTRSRSFDLGLRSNIFASLPIMISSE